MDALTERAAEASKRNAQRMCVALAITMIVFWPSDWWALAGHPDDQTAMTRVRLGYTSWSLVAAGLIALLPSARWTPMATALLISGLAPVSLWAMGGHFARLDEPWFYAAYVVPFTTTALMLPLWQRAGLHVFLYVFWMGSVAWFAPDGGMLRPHWNVVLLYGSFCMFASVVIGHAIYGLTVRTWTAQSEVDGLATALRVRVDEQTAELRDLARFLTEQRETDLAHLSRELHDEFGQLLTALRFDVDLLAMSPDQVEAAGRMSDHLDRMLKALRSALDDLRPQVLDQAGLRPALEWLVASANAQGEVAVELTVPDSLELPRNTALSVFRITQEALTNSARHAQASEVAVRVSVDDVGLTLEVADNGSGLPSAVREGARGIVGMRERALATGGTLDVVSGFGGTTVTAFVPRGEET